MYFVSIDAGTQVAIILLDVDPVWSLLIVGTGFVPWVEHPVQRRLCPILVSGVGVTRHPRVFRGLMGCQRETPVFGVTTWYQSLGIRLPRTWRTWA